MTTPTPFEEAVATIMREELETSRLMVVLVPSDLSHQPTRRKRRVAEERNPEWYRNLCALYQSDRAHRRKHGDTIIRRAHVLRALNEIANGRVVTTYAQRVFPFVQRYGRDLQRRHRSRNEP
jgi:hypothetical protein